MTNAQMTTFLSKAGVTTKSWVELTNIAVINLSSDGNIYTKTTDMYMFDTDTNLLMIKEYFYKRVENGWQLTQISENLADVIIDFANITGFTIGTPLSGIKSALIGTLYGGE